jgi:hypothetical protein
VFLGEARSETRKFATVACIASGLGLVCLLDDASDEICFAGRGAAKTVCLDLLVFLERTFPLDAKKHECAPSPAGGAPAKSSLRDK